MRVNKVLIRPLITEKSVALSAQNRYIFEVSMQATKGAIVDELKNVFNVDATEVRTLIMPGKKRRISKTNRFGKTAKRKKAIVTLKEGQKIDLVSEK